MTDSCMLHCRLFPDVINGMFLYELVAGSACTEGWWEQESYCYAIFPDPLPWAMAALNCARWNSTLVTIKSKADQTIINSRPSLS